jgi:DNA-binding transcriptional LysR family regulator
MRQSAEWQFGAKAFALQSKTRGTRPMLNIPTDLLRTLVTVVALRSFTKAARSLGVTQPAISAQIKRLQHLLGYELMDKSAPGVALTPHGVAVVERARRLLAVNDEIVELRRGRAPAQTVRIGIPCDYSGQKISATMARFRMRWPGIRFVVSTDTSENLLRDIELGDLDIALAVTISEPPIAPRHAWRRQTVWVYSPATKLDPDGPVPLVCYGEECACQTVAVAALRRAGRECDFVYTTRSLVSLAAAVKDGFGVMVVPRGRAVQQDLDIWENPPLPKLPEIYCGLFVQDGGNRSAYLEIVDYLAADLLAEREAVDREAEVRSLRPTARH